MLVFAHLMSVIWISSSEVNTDDALEEKRVLTLNNDIRNAVYRQPNALAKSYECIGWFQYL
jgi:hypothetical protein